MRWTAIALIALAVAGCATPRGPCEPELRVVEVRVPVAVPCEVALIPPPDEAITDVAAGDTVGTLQALLADLRAWRRAYEAQRAAAEGCARAP